MYVFKYAVFVIVNFFIGFCPLSGMISEPLITLQFLDTTNDGKPVLKQYSETVIKTCLQSVAAMLQDCSSQSGSIPITCSSDCFDDAYPFLQALHDAKTKNDCEKKWITCTKNLQDTFLQKKLSQGALPSRLLNIAQLFNFLIVKKEKSEKIEEIDGVDLFAQIIARELDKYILTFEPKNDDTKLFEELYSLENTTEKWPLDAASRINASVPLLKIAECNDNNSEYVYSSNRKYKVYLKTGDIILCKDNKKITSIGHDVQDYNFVFSPQEKFLVYKKDDYKDFDVTLVDLQNSTLTQKINCKPTISYSTNCYAVSFQFSPDEELLCCILRDASGQQVYAPEMHYRIAIFQSENGKKVYEKGSAAKVKFYNDNRLCIEYLRKSIIIQMDKNEGIYSIKDQCDFELSFDGFNPSLDRKFTINLNGNELIEYNNIQSFTIDTGLNTLFLCCTNDKKTIERCTLEQGIFFDVPCFIINGSPIDYCKSSKNTYLAVRYSDNTIGIWNILSGKNDDVTFFDIEKNKFDNKKQPWSKSKILFTADESKLLFTCFNYTPIKVKLFCYDIKTNETEQVFACINQSFKVHSTENVLYIISKESGTCEHFQVYDIDQKKVLFSQDSEKCRHDSNQCEDEIACKAIFDNTKKFFLCRQDDWDEQLKKPIHERLLVNSFTGYIYQKIFYNAAKEWYEQRQYNFSCGKPELIITASMYGDSSETKKIKVNFKYPQSLFLSVLYALVHIHKWDSIEKFPQWLRLFINQQCGSEMKGKIAKNSKNICNVRYIEDSVKKIDKKNQMIWYLQICSVVVVVFCVLGLLNME